MKFGWPISFCLHTLVVLGGLIVFSRGIDAYEETNVIPIETLTIAEFNNIRAAIKAQKPEDISQPETPMQLETPLENAPNEDDPNTAQREPEDPAPSQPAPSDAPADTPLETGPEASTFDLENLSALIDKTRASQPEPEQQQTLQSEQNFYEYAENARRAAGEGTDLTVNEITALQSAMYRCWRIPLDAKNPEELEVRVRVRLRGDGAVQSANLVNPSRVSRSSNPYMQVAAQRAVNAVSKCAPYDFLPSSKYDTWKDMVLRFKPEL